MQKSLNLSQSELLNFRDKHKNTLLHIACGFGRLKSIACLLQICQALINEKDDKGHNPIDVAIKVLIFLKEFICFCILFLFFVQHGQEEVIKWLIDVNVMNNFESDSNNGRSYLHFAAKHGENEILRIICHVMQRNQISLDIQDHSGKQQLTN